MFLPLCVEVINTRFLVLLVSLPFRDGESSGGEMQKQKKKKRNLVEKNVVRYFLDFQKAPSCYLIRIKNSHH